MVLEQLLDPWAIDEMILLVKLQCKHIVFLDCVSQFFFFLLLLRCLRQKNVTIVSAIFVLSSRGSRCLLFNSRRQFER